MYKALNLQEKNEINKFSGFVWVRIGDRGNSDSLGKCTEHSTHSEQTEKTELVEDLVW